MNATEKHGISSHYEINSSSPETPPEALDATPSLLPHLTNLTLLPPSARTMSPLSIVSAGWVICNSWGGLAATFSLAIIQGGPFTMIYGPIIMFVLVGACAATLAELASVYPTAGGQYHWTSILAGKRWGRGISYICGATNVFAWIAICSGIAIIAPQLILGLAVFWIPGYVREPWHAFLVYQAVNLVVLVFNIYLVKRVNWIHDAAFFFSLFTFVIILVACLARSSSNFQPSSAVWTNFLNQSGWPDSIAFLTGLVNANYMYAGIDGAIHLAEECKNAAVAVPQALVSTMIIGFVTSFAFAVVMLYCTIDLEAAVGTVTGVPVFEMWRQATSSDATATSFTIFLLVIVFTALNATHHTASRLTWSFARDNALAGSRWLNQMSPKQHVPISALVFNFAIMFVIGCIYLASTSAFNAFIGTGLILQHITYAIPAALLMSRKRSSVWLPKNRYFRMPEVLGWAANITTVGVAIFVLVFYTFPVAKPVTGGNMNYAVAVIGVMGVFTGANWVLYARKHYRGPRLDMADY